MIVEPLQAVVTAAFGGPQPSSPFGHGGIRPDVTAECIAEAESRFGATIPEALRDYYTVAGRYDGMMAAHFRFLAPEELQIVDRHLVFCHERQHVMEWGVRIDELDRPNPTVYGQLTNGPDSGDWTVESTKLSAFVLGVGCWQAALSGEESGESELSADELADLAEWFEPVGDAGVRDGGTLVGLVDAKHWIVAAYDGKQSMLYVGTSAEDGLENLEERTGLELNWY
jgi:hypothetical protein